VKQEPGFPEYFFETDIAPNMATKKGGEMDGLIG
jgi:hypothetical protein